MDPRAALLSPMSSKASHLLLPGRGGGGGRQPPPRSPSQSQNAKPLLSPGFQALEKVGGECVPAQGWDGEREPGRSEQEGGRTGRGGGGQPERGRGVGNGGRGAGPQGWEREPRGGRGGAGEGGLIPDTV